MRTLLIMLVSLYTVRVTLQLLGVEDYGIYNAVGGLVVIFSFLSNTFTSVSQRYFSVQLGKNNLKALNKTFNALLSIYVFIGLIVIIIAEIVGVWFLNDYLTIPAERMQAAKYVLQFSILTLFVNFIQIPYNSIIISRERMDLYAYISIAEVILKLVVVYLLIFVKVDSLSLYAGLVFGVAVVKFLFYAFYCNIKFEETKTSIRFERKIYTELLSYLGWNTFGVFSVATKNQSIIVMLNMFYGPIVNAAYALASTVSSGMNQFVSSFTLAVQPQIVKKYASGETKQMFDYIYLSSKYSGFLLALISIPCIYKMPEVLKIWLGDYPNNTVSFSILLVVSVFIESLCIPLVTAIQATGKIKSYNIFLGVVMLSSIPLSVLAFKIGANANDLIIISLFITVIAQVGRIYFAKVLTNISIKEYLDVVALRLIYVIFPASAIGYFLKVNLNESITGVIAYFLLSFITTIAIVWMLGMTKSERTALINISKKYLPIHADKIKK